MLKIKFLSLTILLLSCVPTLLAQTQIQGSIQDKKKRTPIEFAHVFFLNQQDIGAITNQMGEFSMHVPKHLMADTLVISQLGYEHYYLPIKSIGQDQQTLLVNLKSNAIVLREAVVISEEGLKKIIQQTIDRIPENYPQKKHRLKGYFQEYSIWDTSYTHFTEAFATIQDPGYSKKMDLNIFLHELRRSDDERQLPEAYENELWSTYRWGSIIRSGRFNPRSKNPEAFLEQSSFHYMGASIIAADTLIRIGYEDNSFVIKGPNGGVALSLHGELVINKTDHAIVKHRYGIEQNDSFQEIRYRKVNGKYFPSQMLSLWTVHFSDSDVRHTNSYSFHFYQVEPTKKDFQALGPHQKILKEKTLQQMEYEYRPDFWENNTFMLQLSASTAVEKDMARKETLKKQFKKNAKRGKKR